MSDLIQKLWCQYAEMLSTTIQLPGVPQLVNPYEPWNWGGQDALGPPSFDQYAFLNRIPSSPITDAQDMTAMPAFAQQYQLFLTQLALGQNGQDTAEYKRLQSAAAAAQGALGTVLASARNAFLNDIEDSRNSTLTFDAWLDGPGFAYKLQMDQRRQTAAAATAKVETYLETFEGPVTNAIAAYEDNLTSVSNNAGSVEVPMWFMTQQPYPYTLQITGNDFGGPATRGTAQSFTLTQDTSEYSYEHVYGNASANLAVGFFTFQLRDGTYENVDMSRFDNRYSITFAFEDLASVSVFPGEWFNGAMLSTYQNGPFQTGQHGFRSEGTPYFFGEGGILARMNTALVVGYRPSITIDGGAEFARYVDEKVQGGAGMRIGPFVIGVSGGSQETSGSVQVDGATVQVVSTGDWPFVVATVSAWTVAPQDAFPASASRGVELVALDEPRPVGA